MPETKLELSVSVNLAINNSVFIERFWKNVQKTDGCWLWMKTRRYGSLGYGAVRLPGRRMQSAHRIAWRLTFGEISNNFIVLHHCDNPPCCRPDHLYLGTPRDNIQDAIKRGHARNGNIKLTPEIWQIIRESKEASGILALRYGVDSSHIRRLRRGVSGRFYRP